MQSNHHGLDWPNQPLLFKIYTSLAPLPLPLSFERVSSGAIDLNMLARLCYFSNGVTKVIRGMPFRAAACTGALYHIELYLICGDLADLPAGVYHFGAHDNALRQLRAGDYRALFNEFADDNPPLYVVLTSTWWRNAWKYQARAYRHAFWDGGTVLANMLAVAAGQHVPAEVLVGFPDADVNHLLDVDPSTEAAIAVVAVGAGGALPAAAPSTPPLGLPTRRLSAHQIDYPEIVRAHEESSLPSAEAVAKWRAQFTPSSASPRAEPVEEVILRRGSSRRFSHDALSLDSLLERATLPFAMDAFIPCDLYLIINAVDGRPSGTYVLNRSTHQLELLREGNFRREAAYLDLGQALAGDAAINAYWLVDLASLDDRAYRAAQLSAAIEAGNLYLGAYAEGLGATGLTFFDDDVTNFFSPHAMGKSVMFLTAVGHPAPRQPGPL